MTDESINTGYIVTSTESGAKVALFTSENGERTWAPIIGGGNDDAGAAGAGAGTGDNAGDGQGGAGDAGSGAGSDNGNSDGGDKTGSSSSDKKDSKVVFDDAQQLAVEKIVGQAHARAMVAGNKKTAEIVESLRAEIAEKDKAIEEAAKKKNKDQFADNSKQIAEMNAKHKEEKEGLEAQVQMAKDAGKTAKILAAIAKHNVVDISDVAQLITGDFELDDNEQLVVQNPDGSIRIDVNENGANMTADAYLVDWLKSHPHHIKSSGHGAGSAGSRYGESEQVPDFTSVETVRNMSDDELKAALSEGVTIQGIHGQKFQFKGETNPLAELRRKGIKKQG